MILTDLQILEEIKRGEIRIEPFSITCLGSNSYDVHLSEHLAVYTSVSIHEPLDAKKENPIERFIIGEDGFVLRPNRVYLASTAEYTEAHSHVPYIDGKSSVGRLGVDIHATAGRGDIGFCGFWTLELSVKQPVRVYAGMPVGQITYFKPFGAVNTKYSAKKNAKYSNQGHLPQPSKMHENKF